MRILIKSFQRHLVVTILMLPFSRLALKHYLVEILIIRFIPEWKIEIASHVVVVLTNLNSTIQSEFGILLIRYI